MDIIGKIAEELKIRVTQVEAAVNLIDEGNTIPFIARYRKEATGSLDDEKLRELGEKLEFYRALDARRADVHRLIDEQGKMTEELANAIENDEINFSSAKQKIYNMIINICNYRDNEKNSHLYLV